MKKQNFEDFLMEKHSENFNGIKDQIVDDFPDWLVFLDVDDFITYADKYRSKALKIQKQEIIKKIDKAKEKIHGGGNGRRLLIQLLKEIDKL